MRAIEARKGPVRLTELAEEPVFERTSLYRTLVPLEREGLVAITNAAPLVEIIGIAREMPASAG